MTELLTVPHHALDAPNPRISCFAAVKSTVASAAFAALLWVRSGIVANAIAATDNSRVVFRYMFLPSFPLDQYCPNVVAVPVLPFSLSPFVRWRRHPPAAAEAD